MIALKSSKKKRHDMRSFMEEKVTFMIAETSDKMHRTLYRQVLMVYKGILAWQAIHGSAEVY